MRKKKKKGCGVRKRIAKAIEKSCAAARATNDDVGKGCFPLCHLRMHFQTLLSQRGTGVPLLACILHITIAVAQQPTQQICLRKVSHRKIIQKLLCAQQAPPRLLRRRPASNKSARALLQTLQPLQDWRVTAPQTIQLEHMTSSTHARTITLACSLATRC